MFLLAIIFILSHFSLKATTLSSVSIFCNLNENFTRNSSYENNLKHAFSVLPLSDRGFGFYKTSTGEGNDTVSAIAFCRGDLLEEVCSMCLRSSIVKVQEFCKYGIEAGVYYEECTLVYYNGLMHEKLGWLDVKGNIVSSLDPFRVALSLLLNELRKDITSRREDYLPMFASGNKSMADGTNLYALIQCIPGLSDEDCNKCILKAMNILFVKHIIHRGGARVYQPICTLIYMNYPFFNITTLVTPPLPPPQGKISSKRRNVIIIIISAVCAIVIASICIFMLLRRKELNLQKKDNTTDISAIESLLYDFETVKAATNDFSGSNKLGEGGFGSVYKGNLQNGQDIAVKRLSKGSRQGEIEFKNEVMLVAKLQHRNLVRFLGFSLEGIERLLIYEFMPNASLDHFIFDPIKRALLDWNIRNKIIKGVARGLLYLHEDSRLRIIHRDLKASNVLLDEEMNPKIADFGMARLCNLQETHGHTNRIVGTFGYMPPEYVMHGRFSVKSDVFSCGVLLLEIITGQKSRNFKIKGRSEFLLSYAWKSWRNEASSDMIDPALLLESSSLEEIIRTIHIGLLCVQNNIAERPTMASVVLMLNSSSFTLQIPSKPAFFMESSAPVTSGSENYNQRSTHSSGKDASIS